MPYHLSLPNLAHLRLPFTPEVCEHPTTSVAYGRKRGSNGIPSSRCYTCQNTTPPQATKIPSMCRYVKVCRHLETLSGLLNSDWIYLPAASAAANGDVPIADGLIGILGAKPDGALPASMEAADYVAKVPKACAKALKLSVSNAGLRQYVAPSLLDSVSNAGLVGRSGVPSLSVSAASEIFRT